MGFIPRRRIKENLRELDVFIEDTDNSIFIVQELPDTFVQGRTAFKIFGSNLLKENIPLKIEILDRDGNPVWTQPVIYGQKSSPSLPYRYISVEVYPPPYNVPGNAELTIVGELDDTKFDIPRELIGTYNVRFSKIINIDTEKIINENPILFYKKPIATATEFVVAQKQTEPPLTRFISGSGLSGTVNQDIKGNSFLSGSQVDTKTEVNDKSESPSGDLKAQANLYKYKTGLYKTNKVMQRRGLKQEKKSPEPPQMRIRSSEKKFITKLVGSDINVNNISLPTSSVLELTGLDPREISIEDIYNSVTFPDYTGKVEDISSDEEIILNKPYAIEFKDPTKPTSAPPVKIFTDIGDIEDSVLANFTASYTDWQAPTVSGYRFDSFIDFTIDDMRTFSGDVYRIKVSGGSDSSQGDFSVLLDTVVDSPELIVDTTSPSGVLRSGYFIDQAHIDKYWNTFGGNNNANQLSAFYTMSLADGMYLSGSYEQYNQVGRVDLDETYPFTVKKDVPYTLTLNVKGKRGIKTNVEGISNQSAKLFFHLSGSNLKDFDESDIQYASSFGGAITDEFGNIVGVEITDDEQISGFKDFGRVSHTFTPSFKLDRVKNTDTTIQLRIHSGEWIISDLSLSSATSTGFSPDEFTLRVPIPPNTLRPDNYDFLIEYLDINGNTAETVTFLDNVPISGSALILEGTDNLLTGSLFMGSAAGEGIESAGANSAFIRSVGYKGFLSASNATGVNSGFMMFSGSVLPDESDDYKGVGLEMVANSSSYFKFRSDPSELDIRADAFFIGDEDSAFVSGSQGNIEISSSKFHLSPGGDVVMNNITASNANLSGKITATSGDIGGFAVEDGQLSSGAGVNSVTMSGDLGLIAMGTGSSFNKSSMAGGLRMGFDTDGQFKFALGSAGSYIHFDSNGVSIKSDSFDVTASVADINVDQFGLTSTNLVISSSGQFIAAGSTVPSGVDGTNKGFFVSAEDNQLLIGDAAGGHFIYDGADVSISSSAFFLGNADNFISGSNTNFELFSSGTTTLSGSAVTIAAPKIFLGKLDSAFVSASEGNIEISSSNFHLQADGDVVMSGQITADSGEIGGFEIASNQINSTNDNVILKSSGQITASAIQLTGEVNIIGGSAKGQLDSLGAETASIKARTASFENSVTSIGAKTSSFAGSIVLIGQKTSSIDENVIKLAIATGSLQAATASFESSIGKLGVATSSIAGNVTASKAEALVTSSLFNVSSIASSSLIAEGSVVSSSFIAAGSIISGSVISTNIAVGSVKSGSIVTDKLAIATGSLQEASASLKLNVIKLAIATGSLQEASASLKTNVISLAIATGSLQEASASLKTNVIKLAIATGSLQEASASLKLNVISLAVQTGSLLEATASIKVDSGSLAAAIQLTSASLNILNSDSNIISEFGANTFVGLQSSEHVKISPSGLELKDASTTLGTFNAGGAIIGKTNEAHISASSVDLSLIFDSNNKAVLDSNSLDFTIGGNQVATFGANPIITGGTVTIRNHTNNNDKVVISENKLEIFDNNVAVAEFAATTTIGNTSNEHIQISGSGLELKDGSAQRFAVNSSGVAVGDNFNVDTSGNVTMAGTVTATAGAIGGFTLANNQLSGSSAALIATNVGDDRIEIRGSDNTIAFFQGSKGGNAKVLEIGNYATSGPFAGASDVIESFGMILSGSINPSSGNTRGAINITNPDLNTDINYGLASSAYQSGLANIFSQIKLSTTQGVQHGRPSIYGEVNSQLASDVGTTGLISGVTGRIVEGTSGRWDMSAGVVGISSAEAMTSEGGGVADGVYGLVSIGNAYVKGDSTLTGNVNIGGGYGSTGIQLQSDGDLLMNGDLTTDGFISVGGGFGSTGALIDSAGNIATNGLLAVDGAITCATINTGQGATEVYAMNQDVETGDSVTFNDVTVSDELKVNDYARIDALRVGTTSTDPGDGNLYVENDLTVVGKIFQGTADTVYFEAQMTGGGTVANNTYTTIPYNNEANDEGGDYNNSTYKFTAPCNGIYFFSAHFLWANDSNWDAGDNPIIGFSVNDADASDGRLLNRTGDFTEFFSMHTTAIIKLDSGDTVNVDAYQNTGATLNLYNGGGEASYNQFMGTLIHSLV